MTWNLSNPPDNEAMSQGASRIRELKSDIAAALVADGATFPGPDTANPKFYPSIQKDTTANRPAASANYPGRMYFNTDTQTLQRVKADGSVWEDLTEADATEAIHAAGETGLVSVGGILTLDETSNCFSITGTEAITSITGWSAGLVYLRWTTSRLLTYSASLLTMTGQSRNILAGDVSVFRFFGAGQVREVGFFGPGSLKLPGEIFMWGGATAPARALECDGSSVTRTSFPALFAAIGTQHGTVDGTHFNVPDLRGKFARGYDHGAGNDPNAAARTAPATGAATGDNVGSVQADDFKAHNHSVTQQASSGSAFAPGGVSQGYANITSTNTGTAPASGGSETRPKNVGLMFCIAY